ncbi:QWRF motif-containing protein 3 [Heracleum sosnowskyi]|uniref:QWRF motif-containing protein 3 n=1 Tax=Heracleum sosnowskyi TaxID=360622 RepID=A0AAD8NE09_9APIA|nr:QWRF motif-containing protein 3 [Heracleum sosnowskyi]
MKKSSVSDEPRKPKFRQVSSRYLHNIPSSPQISIDKFSSLPSTNSSLSSPLWQINKSSSSTTDTRKHRSHDSGLLRKLWPSAGKSSRNGEKEIKKSDNSMFLNRQKSSSTVFSRFDSSPQINGSNSSSGSSTKENHKPFFGGSMRYTGKFKFPGRSSSPSPMNNDEDDLIIPGRMSVDETALRQRSFGGRSLDLLDIQDSGSEGSDYGSNTSLGSPFIGRSSPASYMSPTVSSSFRKSGLEGSSNDPKHRRGTSETNIVTDNFKKMNVKNSVKRANSLTAPSKRSSPQHSNLKPSSPPHMNPKPPTSPSKGKLPPTSPSRSKGVGSFINLGLDLFKNKKLYPSSAASGTAVVSGVNTLGESVHQLRMLNNRLLQWRYTNARGATVNENLTTQSESKLMYAYDALIKLQSSVQQKRLQLEKEKLEMKLNNILLSQIKTLESWSNLERQHQSAVLMTADSLNSAVCRIPLVEGAVVEPETASFALRYASDLAVSIESMLSTYSPEVEKNVAVLAELAKVAAQEKSMLEECLELSKFISNLEIEEWSLKCHAVQLKSLQQQQQQDHPA